VDYGGEKVKYGGRHGPPTGTIQCKTTAFDRRSGSRSIMIRRIGMPFPFGGMHGGISRLQFNGGSVRWLGIVPEGHGRAQVYAALATFGAAGSGATTMALTCATARGGAVFG
jgi:hypothetical protein